MNPRHHHPHFPHLSHFPPFLLPAAILLSAFSLQAFSLSSFAAKSVDAPVPPVDTRAQIEAGLASHDHALHLTTNWIRDPFITRGPDGYYYLTGTTPDENDPREQTDPYNTGLGGNSVVGSQIRIWRSRDLIDWEYRGIAFKLSDTIRTDAPAESKAIEKAKKKNKPIPDTGAPAKNVLWAPEIHWLGDRWALIHCPKSFANYALAPIGEKDPLKGPWTQPLGNKLGEKHDPSLFLDTDGASWMIWTSKMGVFNIAPLNKTLTDFAAPSVEITPSGSRTSKATGETTSRIGHEGSTIIKVPGSNKYIFIGTAWSTDKSRHGSYNLYYATADKITGPYGPRRFLGRFLGHGTPFQAPDGRWWCTAFRNANTLPVSREGIETRDLSTAAHSINPPGLTIVPLTVKVLPGGDVDIRAADPAYATPGPDEAQKFPN